MNHLLRSIRVWTRSQGLTWCLLRMFGAQSAHIMGQRQEGFWFLNLFVTIEIFSLYLK